MLMMRSSDTRHKILWYPINIKTVRATLQTQANMHVQVSSMLAGWLAHKHQRMHYGCGKAHRNDENEWKNVAFSI